MSPALSPQPREIDDEDPIAVQAEVRRIAKIERRPHERARKRDMAKERDKARPIISLVARHTKIPVSTITGDGRTKLITHSRDIAIWLVRTVRKLSFPQLGMLFRRDSSTVQSAISKVENNPTLRAHAETMLDEAWNLYQ